MIILRKDVLKLGHFTLMMLILFGVSFLLLEEQITHHSKQKTDSSSIVRGLEMERLYRQKSVELKSSTTKTATVQDTKEDPLDMTQYPKVKVLATGYYAGVKSTGKGPRHPNYGITYSGVKVRRAHYSTIAADLSRYPLGTILYIPNYGYGVVADRGSAIKGEKLDLYFETIEAVFKEWGKRTVEVYLIKKGDGNLTEEILNQLNRTQVTSDQRK